VLIAINFQHYFSVFTVVQLVDISICVIHAVKLH